jgi:hypothetical protein
MHRGLALQPRSPSAHYNLALLYHNLALESRRCAAEGGGEESERGREGETQKTEGERYEHVSEDERGYLSKAETMYRQALVCMWYVCVSLLYVSM